MIEISGRVLGRCFNRLIRWFFVVSFIGLLLFPVVGDEVLVMYILPFLLAGVESYYREEYQVGRTKVVDPHVLEWTSDGAPFFTKGYLGIDDSGEDFAWVCRYCGEYAIDGETEQLADVDCENMTAFEHPEELRETNNATD